MPAPVVTPSEVRIAGQVWLYVAPVGTAYPADIDDDPASPWTNLGAITRNSFKITPSLTVAKFLPHQSTQPIRTAVTERSIVIGAELMQTNETSLIAAFGGGAVATVVGTPTKYRFTPPAPSDRWSRACLVDVLDGAVKTRWYFDEISAESLGEIVFSLEDLMKYTMTFTVLAGASGGGAGWYMETTDASFA